MQLITGINLFTQPTTAPNTIFIATTNAEIVDGRLIMGGGSARDMRIRYPGSDRVAAMAIASQPTQSNYGFLMISPELGIFQTKTLIRDLSKLDLIKTAAMMLAKEAKAHPTWEYRLPFPGIGLGGLKESDVMPIITDLPNNVIVYRV